jgi:hypothetical protein
MPLSSPGVEFSRGIAGEGAAVCPAPDGAAGDESGSRGTRARIPSSRLRSHHGGVILGEARWMKI